MNEPRLYILIDKTLDPIYGCVQGGHAVAQWLLEHSDQKWNNHYLIYLKCNIYSMLMTLDMNHIDYSCFREPDLGNKVTAIAIYSKKSNLTNKLKLI